MTGDVRFRLAAGTLPELIQMATERWRIFVDDPEVALPWSTHFTAVEEERADDGSDLDVWVRITFDRTTIPASEPAD